MSLSETETTPQIAIKSLQVLCIWISLLTSCYHEWQRPTWKKRFSKRLCKFSLSAASDRLSRSATPRMLNQPWHLPSLSLTRSNPT